MVSVRRQTIEKWCAGFSTFDRNTVVNFRADECEQIVVPSDGKPLSKEQLIQIFTQFEGVTAGARQDVHLWIEDEAQNTLAIWTTLTVKFQSENIDDYVGNYMLVFQFTEDQTKYTKFLEFIDTGTTVKLLTKVSQGLQELGRPPLAGI